MSYTRLSLLGVGASNHNEVASGALQAANAEITTDPIKVQSTEDTRLGVLGLPTRYYPSWTAATPIDTPPTGTGTITADTATMAGVATPVIVATGAIQASIASMAGTATPVIVADGSRRAWFNHPWFNDDWFNGSWFIDAPTAQRASMAGTASGTPNAQINAAIQASTASMDGTATIIIVATGTLQADTALIDGGAGSPGIASGNPQADTATIIGTATNVIVATGALQASTATAKGRQSPSVGGNMEADTATMAGTANVITIATGTLQANPAGVWAIVGDYVFGDFAIIDRLPIRDYIIESDDKDYQIEAVDRDYQIRA